MFYISSQVIYNSSIFIYCKYIFIAPLDLLCIPCYTHRKGERKDRNNHISYLTDVASCFSHVAR